jgi:SAM-dependent methyltransferase
MALEFPAQLADEIRSLGEDYAREKRHSDMLDRTLGLDIRGVEDRVKARAARHASQSESQLWEHLSPGVFQTPYSELFRILRELGLSPGGRVVDLGAGYGRMAFVVEAFFPGVSFTGYELSRERVEEARRVFALQGLEHSEMIEADLEAPRFSPIDAEAYFLYDFGTRTAIEKCLGDLKWISRSHPIRVAARGRASRDAIERGHPWLSQVNPPKHFAHYSVYSS